MSSVKKKLPDPEIIYQDKNIFVINKPAGWVTLKVNTYKGFTLQDWVEKKFQEIRQARNRYKNSAFIRRFGIAHRLDKDTSGLILGGKDEQSFQALQSQFKTRQVKKEYWALVRGKLKSEGKLVSPIGRLPSNKLKRGVTLTGKPSVTKFKPLCYYKINNQVYTLVIVWPKTGRTHQIRVHFKHLGHPVFGDQLYGGKKETNKNMFLVAKKISFFHPKTENIYQFEIDLPIKLRRIIDEAKKTK